MQGRETGPFYCHGKANTQNVQSNLQVDRCVCLSSPSKASCASDKDVKSKLVRTLLCRCTHTSQISYLEVRWYQSSKTKRGEHFITGERERDITH